MTNETLQQAKELKSNIDKLESVLIDLESKSDIKTRMDRIGGLYFWENNVSKETWSAIGDRTNEYYNSVLQIMRKDLDRKVQELSEL